MNTYDHGMYSSLFHYDSFKDVLKTGGGVLANSTFIGLYFMVNILRKKSNKANNFYTD